MRAAALDLGTNTFELLIAEIKPSGEWCVLVNEEQPVFLGKEGIEDGIIGPAARQRALACLAEFAVKVKAHRCTQVVCTATSAFRNAQNAAAFKQKILDQTGFDVKVIDGRREASLIAKGTMLAMRSFHCPYLIMDIGGGSTEFALVVKDKVLFTRSIEIGATRLLERYALQDPPADELTQMKKDIASSFAPIVEQLRKNKVGTLVGGSGTFDSFLGMLKIERSGPNALLPAGQLKQSLDACIAQSRQQRMKMPGLAEFRKDTIVPSSMMVEHFLENGVENIYWSAKALKEGLMEEMLKESRSEN